MSESSWIGYIGMATGIIGAITGIAGSVMGYISYKKSSSLKSLDLRLELRKTVNGVKSKLQQLEKLIEDANKSRQAVASARGWFKSGAMEKWKKEVEADENAVRVLFQNALVGDERYDDLTSEELEKSLVEVHRLQLQIDELINKYQAAVRADDEERKHIREDMNARHAPRL